MRLPLRSTPSMQVCCEGIVAMTEHARRLEDLNRKLKENDLDGFVICDPDNVYYFTGSENYIGMDFGRPTILFVARDEEPVLMVPGGDVGMVEAMAKSIRVVGWADSAQGEWRTLLGQLLAGREIKRMGFETQFNPLVYSHLRSLGEGEPLLADEIIQQMRLIKSAAEIADLRNAGKVADAMMDATRDALRVGVREFELSLAAIEAGTRKAAELLAEESANSQHSPVVNYLQIMKSGANTDLGHCRPGLKCVSAGEPVAVCLCGMINYKHMKLAMDRPFFVGRISKEDEIRTRIALESQAAALALVKPGAPVADVHAAASAVLEKHGYAPCTRTGRGLGASFAEKPQIMTGDPTILQPGMVLAVDGNLTVKGFGVQFGDSVLVTDNEFEFLTNHTRDLQVL
jgi:Xaa-Pro aminopeptidase